MADAIHSVRSNAAWKYVTNPKLEVINSFNFLIQHDTNKAYFML
jgi:hypothetical protein